MKTKEYVKKYELDQNDNFDWNNFINDLAIDFYSLLQVGKGRERIKGYENAVNAIKQKYDAVNNKTVGCIDDRVWKSFYAKIVAPLREELFPKEMQKRRNLQADYERRKKEREAYWESMNSQKDDFFFFMLAGLFRKKVPTESFDYLGISTDSNKDEINRSFYKLAKTCHPDVNPGKQAQFLKLTEHKNKCLQYATNQKRN